jgi:hypothetical protein
MVKTMAETKIYQMLISSMSASTVVDDWYNSSHAADIRIRRAKTKGHVVIETTDTLFAQRLLLRYGCKVNIIE